MHTSIGRSDLSGFVCSEAANMLQQKYDNYGFRYIQVFTFRYKSAIIAAKGIGGIQYGW